MADSCHDNTRQDQSNVSLIVILSMSTVIKYKCQVPSRLVAYLATEAFDSFCVIRFEIILTAGKSGQGVRDDIILSRLVANVQPEALQVF